MPHELIPQKEHPGNRKEQTPLQWRGLKEWELQAIQLRSQGNSSEEIARAVGYKAGYLRKLFMQGGRLFQPYTDYVLYCQSGVKEVADIVIERAKAEAPKAMERMVELSKDAEQGAVSYKANEYVLTQAGMSGENTVRSYMQKHSFEETVQSFNELAQEVYGKPLLGNSLLTLSDELMRRVLERMGKQEEISPPPEVYVKPNEP